MKGSFSLSKRSPLIIIDLCVGGAILGIPIAIVGYYLSFKAITVYRQRVRERVRELRIQRKLKAKAKKKNKQRKSKQTKTPTANDTPTPPQRGNTT